MYWDYEVRVVVLTIPNFEWQKSTIYLDIPSTEITLTTTQCKKFVATPAKFND